MDTEELKFWSWLAGFCDGEATFFMQKESNGGFSCHFALSLRADDWRALQHACETTCLGYLKYMRPNSGGLSDGSPANPLVKWSINTIEECLGLMYCLAAVGELRAKKQRDYILWTEALCLIAQYGGGKTSPVLTRLVDIHAEMIKVRAYSSDYALGYESFLGRGRDGRTDRHREKSGRRSKIWWASDAAAEEKKWRANRYAKVSQAQIDELVIKYKAGNVSMRALGAVYGISQQKVSDFVNNKYTRRD